jgi:hypothetical protein
MDKMFKPEFRFLIDQEDGEILPLIDSHLFTTFAMVVGLNIALIIGLLCVLKVGRIGLSLVFKGLTKIWSQLTPGNQWQELFLIGSSIFLGSMLILIMNEILKKLDDSFTKLNNQLKEKDALIVALEEKLALNLIQDSVESEESVANMDLKEEELLLKESVESVESDDESVEYDESESDDESVEYDESESDESESELWGVRGTPVKSDEIKTHINNLLTNRYEYLRRDPMKKHLYNNDEEE